jgi:hypothetical protein
VTLVLERVRHGVEQPHSIRIVPTINVAEEKRHPLVTVKHAHGMRNALACDLATTISGQSHGCRADRERNSPQQQRPPHKHNTVQTDLTCRRRGSETGLLQAARDIEPGRRYGIGRHERAADVDEVGVVGLRIDDDVVAVAAQETERVRSVACRVACAVTTRERAQQASKQESTNSLVASKANTKPVHSSGKRAKPRKLHHEP